MTDSNPSKCNCPVDSCLMRARPHQHLTLFPMGTTAIESVLLVLSFLGGGGYRIRKAALGNSPVDCFHRRGFAAAKRIRSFDTLRSWWPLFLLGEADSNPSKCHCPVDSGLMRARPHQALTLLLPEQWQANPSSLASSSTNQRGLRSRPTNQVFR